jgi:hypothetical protein
MNATDSLDVVGVTTSLPVLCGGVVEFSHGERNRGLHFADTSLKFSGKYRRCEVISGI